MRWRAYIKKEDEIQEDQYIEEIDDNKKEDDDFFIIQNKNFKDIKETEEKTCINEEKDALKES